MYKVFLVEDEIVVREGIKNNIRWEEADCVIVGDESDGELAYPRILKEQPDILITDIRMPFMDGLELSKLLKKDLPQLKIIIISGYSDFSYAQQAIDIGVTEYIVKPVTSEKLISAVKNASRGLHKERSERQILEQYQQLVYQQQGEKRKDFFDALVSGKLSLSRLLEKEEELGIHMVARFFCVVLFQFQVQKDLYEYSDEIVRKEAKMQEILKKSLYIKIFERGIEGWAFIVLGETEEEIRLRIHELCETLVQLSEPQDGYGYFGGIGVMVQRVRDLQESFLEANKAFSQRFFTKDSRFVGVDDPSGFHEPKMDHDFRGNQVSMSELNLEKLDRNLLEEFLKRGTIKEVDAFVSGYFEGFDQNAMKSSLFRQYIMMDGYSAIMKFLTEQQFSKESIEAKLKELQDQTIELHHMEDCIEFYKKLLRESLELRNQKSRKKYSALIEKAKEYIQEHYASDEITLDQVASVVNISPNYFSTLFNQETGMTFIEYLTEQRMDKAKEYLLCSSKRITEIGYSVGYADSHYFSYIFKKTQNCTPSEYRTLGIGER